MIKRRRESATGFYHVVGKGINHEMIFAQQREKVYFKKIIKMYLEKYDVKIYAYCIMSNHFHMIVKSEIQSLSLFMARILAKYAYYYNYKHHRNGHVFQNRFTSECIENEGYLWNCIRYIHNNPVKANMVKNPIRYKYSSMGEYITETAVLLDQKALDTYKERFSEKEQFEEFHTWRQYNVFSDIKDEVEIQRLEIARYIAEQIFEKKKLQLLIQVFEEKQLCEEYVAEIRQILKVSQRKAKELCRMTYNQVESA